MASRTLQTTSLGDYTYEFASEEHPMLEGIGRAIDVRGGNSDVLRDIAERFGLHIVFFKETGDTGTDGMFSGYAGDILYLNADSRNNLMAVLGHEVSHAMYDTASDIWRSAAKNLQPLVRKWGNYRAQFADQNLTDRQVFEEFFGDTLAKNFMDTNFWNDVRRADETFFSKLVDLARSALDKMSRYVNSLNTDAYLSDIDAARKVMVDATTEYAKSRTQLPSAIEVDGTPMFSRGARPAPTFAQRLRGEDKTYWEKVKGVANNWLAPERGLPSEIYKAKETLRDPEAGAGAWLAQRYPSQLDTASKAAFGKRYRDLDDNVRADMVRHLQGRLPRNPLPESVRVVLDSARLEIDRLSNKYVELLETRGKQIAGDQWEGMLEAESFEARTQIINNIDNANRRNELNKILNYIETIRANEGQYTNRAYRVFSDKDWYQKLSDDVIDRGVAFFEQQHKEQDVRDIARKASRMRKEKIDPAAFDAMIEDLMLDFDTLTTDQIVEAVNEQFSDPVGQDKVDEWVAKLGEFEMRDYTKAANFSVTELVKGNRTAFGSFERFISESKLGSKDLSIMKRKNLDMPVELRELMGEYTEVPEIVGQTMTKLSSLVANQAFLQEVYDKSNGVLFFDRANAPEDHVAQIASDGNFAYSPLAGLYTTPEVAKAMADAVNPDVYGAVMQNIIAFNAAVKAGKTVGSIPTQIRNFVSGWFLTMRAGVPPLEALRNVYDSIQTARTYFGNSADAEIEKRLRRYLMLGVINDSAHAREVIDIIEQGGWRDPNSLLGKIADKTKLRGTVDALIKSYAFGDDAWRMATFEHYVKKLMDVKGLPREQVERDAAQLVRDLYPTYSKTGKLIQKLRVNPLIGTFVAFPSEVIRTTINAARIHEQYKNDPQMKEIATGLIVNHAFSMAFMPSLAILAAAMHGLDDEEEEAQRGTMAPYNQNATIIPLGRDERGVMQFFDASFIDPSATITKPFMALVRGVQSPDVVPATEAIQMFIGEWMAPFFSPDIVATAAAELALNRKINDNMVPFKLGGPLWNETDTPENITTAIGEHIFKAIAPGTLVQAENIRKGFEEHKTKWGREYTPLEEVLAMGGIRTSRTNPVVALGMTALETRTQLNMTSNSVNSMIKDPNEVDRDELTTTINNTNERRKEIYSQLLVSIRAAKQTGVSSADIKLQLEDASIPKRAVNQLMMGKLPEDKWKPHMPSLRRDARVMGSQYGEDVERSILQRADWARESSR